MQWHSVGEFFAMGGYALYVWGSFGVTAVALAIEPFCYGSVETTFLEFAPRAERRREVEESQLMYVPAHFQETRSEALQALMREHPLATLVVSSADGRRQSHPAAI